MKEPKPSPSMFKHIPDLRSPPHALDNPKRSRLERLSWIAQLAQALTNIFLLFITVASVIATLIGIVFVAWQLRESSMIPWRTFIDERAAAFGDRIQEDEVAACVFPYEIERGKKSPIDEQCDKSVFEKIENIRSHINNALDWLSILNEVNYFDYQNTPTGIRRIMERILNNIGFNSMSSTLGFWYRGLRSDIAADITGVFSFILVNWHCGSAENPIACAEDEAQILGICAPKPLDNSRCQEHETRMACAMRQRCFEHESDVLSCIIISRCRDDRSNRDEYSNCLTDQADVIGMCTSPDDCLCADDLRSKSDNFVARIKSKFPSSYPSSPGFPRTIHP